MKEYNFKINGNDYVVGIQVQGDSEAEVVVNGSTYSVEIGNSSAKPTKTTISQPQVAPAAQTSAAPASKPAVSSGAGESVLKSPLPGVILDLKVNVGDTVAMGQTLLVLEAMKMENNIEAEIAGVVKAIHVKSGDSVLEGNVLLTIS